MAAKGAQVAKGRVGEPGGLATVIARCRARGARDRVVDKAQSMRTTASSRIGRPLLAGMFIAGGLDAFRHPDAKVETAEVVTGRVEGKGPIPTDTAPLVKLNGGVQIVAGVLLSCGVLPRLDAACLLGSLIPTTLAGHRFWEKEGDERKAQRVHFLNNLAMMGGLLEVIGSSRPRARVARPAR